LENRHLVDQKGIAARRRVLDFIAANRELLAAQGSVVACWREQSESQGNRWLVLFFSGFW